MNLRLSEAIRLGSTLEPQAYDSWTPGRSCALQAAAQAIGIDSWLWLQDSYPMLRLTTIPCPVSCCSVWEILEHKSLNFGPLLFQDVVWHLNDQHFWTREQIADYVETVENDQERHLLWLQANDREMV